MSNFTVADYFAQTLKNEGIDTVFVYPGGTIAPLFNACIALGIKVEVFKSEQGAGFAALAKARITNRPQVCMVTSGPGATNAITPLADAYYDSTPFILVTGQVGTPDLLSRNAVRQRGFQEIPTVNVTSPISKHAVCLTTTETALEEIKWSFSKAMSGRRGPVVLDFPMDIQRTALETDEIRQYKSESPALGELAPDKSSPINPKEIDDIAEKLSKSVRPVILLGQGAFTAGRYDDYRKITEVTDALVVSSLLGIGSYNSEDDRYLGYVGHTGHLAANRVVYQCDFLIVLGSRLDVRQTGTLTDQFAPGAQIVWVNSDSTELDHPRVKVTWAINADIGDFCDCLVPVLKERQRSTDQEWMQTIKQLRDSRPEDEPLDSDDYISPRPVLDVLKSKTSGHSVTIVTGVGCHQHWAARHLPYKPDSYSLLTSGGHGTMGYDLPSAVGAALTQPGKMVLCLVGDGSLLMNIQELAAAKERDLNIKIMVFNNSRLGIVSQFQRITWSKDPTTGDFIAPDFCKVAKAFGLAASHLQREDEIDARLSWLLEQEGPALLDIRIDPRADVVPMLLGGQTMENMWSGYENDE